MQLKCPPELSGAMLKTAPPLRRSPLKKETTQSEAGQAAEAAQVCSLKSASGAGPCGLSPGRASWRAPDLFPLHRSLSPDGAATSCSPCRGMGTFYPPSRPQDCWIET